MLRILLPISSVLAACTPSPQKAAMPSSTQVQASIAQGSREASPRDQGPYAPDPAVSGDAASGATGQAARGPIVGPNSAADKAVRVATEDSPMEALGRRTLSTALVRVGPDGHLTVELRDGRVLILRDVVMRRKDYCAMEVPGDPTKARYCGGYAEVAAARPGGAPLPAQPDPAASSPIAPTRPAERR